MTPRKRLSRFGKSFLTTMWVRSFLWRFSWITGNARRVGTLSSGGLTILASLILSPLVRPTSLPAQTSQAAESRVSGATTVTGIYPDPNLTPGRDS
jgi:hypothetical protein